MCQRMLQQASLQPKEPVTHGTQGVQVPNRMKDYSNTDKTSRCTNAKWRLGVHTSDSYSSGFLIVMTLS